MSETYIFYADVYIIQNFAIKSTVLYLTMWSQKLYSKISVGKILFVAFVGTITEVWGLLFGENYTIFLVVVHLVEVPLMMLLLLGKEKKYLVNCIVTSYFFILVINGVLEALWNLFGQMGHYFFFLIISCVSVVLCVFYSYHHQKVQRRLFPVEVIHMGKIIKVMAFYDSGNHLKDPYTGKNVHILSEKQIEHILGEDMKSVWIPYQALGTTSGLLKVYYIETMKIWKKQKLIELQDSALGVAEQAIFEGKPYEMILNKDIW